MQVLFQTAITMMYFMGIRNPTFAQWVSQFTSMIMVVLALLKALMPPGFWSNKEKSLISKVKNTVHMSNVVSGLFGMTSTGLIMMVANLWRILPVLSPSYQTIVIVMLITGLIFEVLANIFMFKNCMDKLKQVQLRCVILSLKFFYVVLTNSFVFYVLVLPNWSHIGNGGIAMYSFLVYANLSNAILFAKAAFTVTRLRDIFSFDVMTSKGGSLWNICFHFSLVVPITFIVILLMSSSTMYYN